MSPDCGGFLTFSTGTGVRHSRRVLEIAQFGQCDIGSILDILGILGIEGILPNLRAMAD